MKKLTKTIIGIWFLFGAVPPLKLRRHAECQKERISTYTHHHTAEGNTITLNDFMVYGSSRLGSYVANEPEGGTTTPAFTAANLRFELTDHLGTVRAVITGEKTGEGEANIISLSF